MTRTLRATAVASAISLLLGATFVGAAIAQQADSSGKKVVLTVGTPSDIVSPNPFKACCGSEYEMMFLNYDMLYNFSTKDLSAEPALATSAEHSSDYKTWKFEIRDDAVWSDGVPLTAKDIAFTYSFIVNEEGTGTFNDYLPYNPKFSAPDDTHLIWKSEEPTFAPTIPPWIPILPEHIWSKYEGEDAKTIKSVENVPAVGSGPFHLTEWKEGQFWTMEANHDYWGGDPAIDEIVYRVYDNQEAMAQALKSGEIQFADSIKPTIWNSLKGDPNITTHLASPAYFDNLAFNFRSTNLPAVNDLNLRLAIAHAIDKQALVERVMQGAGTVGSSITMPQSRWHWEPTGDEVQAFDLDKSRQILDDAGYKDTDGDGVREDPKTGRPLEMITLTLNNLLYSQDMGKLIQGWLKQVGIKVILKPVSETKAYDVWATKDWDAYLWDWGGDPDPDFITSIFTTGQCLIWSDGCYSNGDYDKLYDLQRTQTDPADRAKTIDKMQKMVYEQVPEVVLVYENDPQAYRNDAFTGYIPAPEPDGCLIFCWGPQSYIALKPVAGGATAGESTGISSGVWIGIVVALVVVVGGIAIARRRKPDEERV